MLRALSLGVTRCEVVMDIKGLHCFLCEGRAADPVVNVVDTVFNIAATVRRASFLNAPSSPAVKGRFTLVPRGTGYTYFMPHRFLFFQESRHDVV
jgi:hypothetical protein